MKTLRVGLAQINCTVGDFEGNVGKIADTLERARGLGVQVIAFPELAIPGYPPEDLLFKPAFIEANLRALDAVARASRGLTAVVGFVDRRDDIFNAAAVLHDGAIAGIYHKQYLPNYGVFDENRYFQAGTQTPVFTLGDVTFAVNVCEDLWYPTGPTTVQALAGAELVITINSSPYHSGKGHDRGRMVATRAADDLVCLAYVNMVGGQDELVFDGGSLLVNAHGECVARGRQFEEDLAWRACSGPGSATRGAARRSAAPRSASRVSPWRRSPFRRRHRRCPRESPWSSCRRSTRSSARSCSAPATTSARTGSPGWSSGCPAGSIPRWWPPSPWPRSAARTSSASPCRRSTPRPAPVATRGGSPGTSASSSSRCPSAACCEHTSGGWPGRSRV
jgi:predicted amidohydrolase